MIPGIDLLEKLISSLSRVCGDDPQGSKIIKKKAKFVPRMRG